MVSGSCAHLGQGISLESISLTEEQNWKDEEKKKYFKIEKSHTAPSSAAWSSSNVKRRKHDDAQAAAAIKKLRIQAARVKRARVLQEPLTGGFLNRMFRAVDPYEVSYAAFAQGLRDKGRLNYPGEPASADDVEPNLSCLYVNGSDEKTGLGVAYVGMIKPFFLFQAFSTDICSSRMERQDHIGILHGA